MRWMDVWSSTNTAECPDQPSGFNLFYILQRGGLLLTGTLVLIGITTRRLPLQNKHSLCWNNRPSVEGSGWDQCQSRQHALCFRFSLTSSIRLLSAPPADIVCDQFCCAVLSLTERFNEPHVCVCFVALWILWMLSFCIRRRSELETMTPTGRWRYCAHWWFLFLVN